MDNKKEPVTANDGLDFTGVSGKTPQHKNTNYSGNSKQFTFATKKTLCPCGEHTNFNQLTSHESGGKCWSCNKFFAPKNATTSPNYSRPIQPTQNEQKTSVTPLYKFDREHIYWTPDGNNYLMKVTILKTAEGKKMCPQFRWNGELVFQSDGSLKPVGTWEKGIEGIQTTLYDAPILVMLQKLEQAEKDKHRVFIPEGEKCCNTLKKHGFIATCNPMGAKKWKSDYNDFFQGLTCCIIPDNDVIGHEHAQMVFQALQGIAKRLQIIDLLDLMPDLPPKGDVTDYLERGGKL